MATIRVINAGDDLGEFDLNKVTNSDAYLIENTYGLSIKGFIEGIGDMRAAAIDALLWLMYRKQGRQVDKSVIRWELGTLQFEQVDAGDPTEAVSGTADADGLALSPTSAI